MLAGALALGSLLGDPPWLSGIGFLAAMALGLLTLCEAAIFGETAKLPPEKVETPSARSRTG